MFVCVYAYYSVCVCVCYSGSNSVNVCLCVLHCDCLSLSVYSRGSDPQWVCSIKEDVHHTSCIVTLDKPFLSHIPFICGVCSIKCGQRPWPEHVLSLD